MARDPHDVALTKAARQAFVKKFVDLGQADLRVAHGVVYVRGAVKLIKGEGSENADLKEQVKLAEHVLRNKAGVKDVILDVLYRS